MCKLITEIAHADLVYKYIFVAFIRFWTAMLVLKTSSTTRFVSVVMLLLSKQLSDTVFPSTFKHGSLAFTSTKSIFIRTVISLDMTQISKIVRVFFDINRNNKVYLLPRGWNSSEWTDIWIVLRGACWALIWLTSVCLSVNLALVLGLASCL